MADELISTKELAGMRVVGGKKRKRIGKVRRFVFHPSERRCIGFLVKRPDAALMFHRKDLFVALGGYDIDNGEIVVRDESEATERGAIKALGVDWNACVIWVGMPVLTRAGEKLGYIANVTFNGETGEVSSLAAENGAANDAILGRRVIPGDLVEGFRRFKGSASADEPGAILVADEAADIPVEGGVAAAAGKVTAKAAHTAKKQIERAKPVAGKAAAKTGAAVEKGTYAVGKQIGRASGMFAAFKEEYDKAAHGDGGDGGDGGEDVS